MLAIGISGIKCGDDENINKNENEMNQWHYWDDQVYLIISAK